MKRRLGSAVRVTSLLALVAGLCASCGGGSSSSGSAASSSATPSCTTSPAAPFSVPGVDGYQVPQADYDIRCAGLRLAASAHQPNMGVPNGFVITSSPAQGTPEQADAAVQLIVSTGPYGCGTCEHLVGGLASADRRMPDICGLTVRVADTVLAIRGITLAEQTLSRASSADRGTIVGFTPAAHVLFLAYGNRKTAQEVVVTVSSGPGGVTSPGGVSGCR